MARRCVYRKSVGKNAKGRSIKRGYYRARYLDARGDEQDHVIVLPNGSKTTDKAVAEAWLRDRLREVGREAVGLVDASVEAALTPMDRVIDGYIDHLRRHNRTSDHVNTTSTYLKALCEWGGIERLGDFRATRIDKALGEVVAKGRAPRTINAYRERAYSLAECKRAPEP